MDTSATHFTHLITVAAGFKPSVQLPIDFENPDINARLVKGYIPTTQSIELLADIARSFNPSSTERARMLVGTFGTGKSDLLLMIGNYFAHAVDVPHMHRFYTRLPDINPYLAETIIKQRENKPPFLVVMLQADAATSFPGFILHGLQQALVRVGLDHLMDRTKYQAAAEQIDMWKQENHPRLSDFRKLLQEREAKELNGLLAELKGPQADTALRVFQRLFKDVTGSEFNIYGYSQPHEAYMHVAQSLQKTGSHSGILIVCDEFTEFLRRFEHAIDQQAAEIDSETKAVENLAERSSTSGRAQIHFIVASLESFASASKGSSTTQASRAIERSAGRFKQHSLDVQNSEELIRGVIHRTALGREFKLPNHQRDELLSIAWPLWKQRQQRNRDWVETVIIDGAFPLHPFTMLALPLINRKVAQSQRTMFLFLTSEDGLSGFLKTTPLKSAYRDWVNLLTLDKLFDYFYESIETKLPEITEAYTNSFQRLHTATVDITVAEKILKVVALCEVVNDSSLSPTQQFLRQAINAPESAHNEVITALNILEQLDAIYPPSETESDTGIYSLPMLGRVSSTSLRRHVKEAAQALPTDVARLQSEYPAKSVSATSYNTRYGTHRELDGFYVGVDALHSPSRVSTHLNQARDGVLWYVIATNDSEQATARSSARELTHKYPDLIIGVPSLPLNILVALRDYEALEAVRSSPQTSSEAKTYLGDSGQVGKGYKQVLDTALAQLRDPKQWEWFAEGNHRPAKSLSDVASLLMEKRFSSTPVHHLAQHFKPDRIGNTDAIESIIKGDIRIGSKKSTRDTILSKAAVELGLVKSTGKDGSFEVYVLTEPSGQVPKSRTVWQLMSKQLIDKRSWSDIVAKMRKHPYGMYDSLILLFTASFVAYNADSIEIVSTKAGGTQRALPIDVALLKKMLEQPDMFTVRFQPLTDQQKQWLRSIGEQVTGKNFDQSAARGTTLQAAVAEQIGGWIKRLQLPAFVESLSVEFMQQIEPETDPKFLDAGLRLVQSKDLSGDLLKTIPHALGLPDDSGTWTDTGVLAALEDASIVFNVVTNLPAHLKHYAVKRIASVFGSQRATEQEAWLDIYRWRRDRSVVEGSSLDRYPRQLFRLTNNPSGSIERELLNDFAREIVGINSDYQRWSSLARLDRLESELRRAKSVIDEAWHQAAPSEDVWLSGVSGAALGRPQSGVKTPHVARDLATWTNSVQWPASTSSMQSKHLKLLYPELDDIQLSDLRYLLQHSNIPAEQWEAEVMDGLAKQFGVRTWRRDDVQTALKRLTDALRHAATLEVVWRQYCLNALADLFSIETTDTYSRQDTFDQWLRHHAIPPENDLSNEATLVLHHLREGATNPETTLLSTLPRSMPKIEQPYQQWNTYELFDAYRSLLGTIIQEIESYVPVTDVEYHWLTGIVTTGLGCSLSEQAHEQKKLVALVCDTFRAWRQNLQLPQFTSDLDTTTLAQLFPGGEATTISLALHLLKTNAETEAAEATFLLHTLPLQSGLTSERDTWNRADIDAALKQVQEASALIRILPNRLRHYIYASIASVFGISMGSNMPLTSLEEQLNHWYSQYILLPSEQLSPNAQNVYDLLQRTHGDIPGLLLNLLPKRIQGVQAPYAAWNTWDAHHVYVEALREATREIAEKGAVKDATPRAQELWSTFHDGLARLDTDERRWLIKQVQDELGL